jgi:hypothetical protein
MSLNVSIVVISHQNFARTNFWEFTWTNTLHLTLIPNTCAPKLNKSLYCINRAKNFLSNKALKTLYYSLIHSHLSYCTPILNCANNSNIQTIYKIQKKAIRTVTRNNYLAHKNPIFVEHKILPLPKLTVYSELKLMHSIIYGYCPPSLRHLFQRNEQRDLNQNLRNADDITVPHPRIKLFKKSLLYRLSVGWNALTDLKLQHNKTTFKISLKEHLFDTLSNE